MARDRYEEALRLYVETAGDDELKQLLATIGDVGDTADLQSNIARKAMQRFAQSIEDLAKIDALAKLKRQLADTETQLEQAQHCAQALFREFKEGDTSSPQIARAQRDARKAVTDLQAAAQGQRLELQRLRSELAASGLDTRKLGTAQGELRQRMADARKVLADSGKSIQQFRANSKQAATDVPKHNREIAQSYTLIERGAGRLRGVIAGVAGYLGLREAAQGIKNLLGIGAAAENAKRALQNLYGSQAAGNRAYADLRKLAAENGLAFDSVLDSSKKLKAFGLDPLNGSLQALIDQNAAVGGSQQDLEGKVLALGQAWAKQKLQGEEILQLTERGVPVWDMLQKATGKSVAELQKLSEQGKLGRDVIKALYEEIGKANDGAANRGLTGLTGLMAQVSARWQDFLTKVADAGVTDYFKQQIQSLLGSTGNLDSLARKVADGIITTLEALRKLGREVAAVASPIASATLALARHAEAVVLLAKVYAALKFSKIISDFALVAAASGKTGAAVQSAAKDILGAGQASTALGAAIGRLPKSVLIAVSAIGLDYTLNSFIQLNDALDYRKEALNQVSSFERAQGELQQEQLRLGQQLQELYRNSANVVIQSGERVGQMTADQAREYQFALEQAKLYYGGVIREARATKDAQKEAAATERWRALGGALDEVKGRVKALHDEAANGTGFAQMSAKAVEKFDEVFAKTGSLKKAISGIFNGIDLTQADGLKQAVAILDHVSVVGPEAAAAIKTELRAALAGVANEDLPALKEAAEKALGSSSEGAKLFAAELNRINLSRLGVDVDAIKSGFTDAGRAAVDGFRAAIGEVEKLGLTAEQRSQAIAQAFDNAFKQANSKAELTALKAALQDALSAGNLGFAEFQQRVAEVDAKLAELGGTGKKMGQDVADGATQASSALSQVGAAGETAAEGIETASTAAEKSRTDFEIGGKAGQQYALTLVSISDKARAAYEAVTQMQTGIGDSGRRFAEGINAITSQVNQQGQAIEDQIKRLQAASEEEDQYAQRRRALAAQYDLVGEDQIERLLAAERKADELQQRRAAEASKQREDEARDREAAQRDAEAQILRQREAARSAAEVSRSLLEPVQAPKSSTGREPIEVVLKVDATGAALNAGLQLSRAQIDAIARQLAPMVIRALEQARLASR